MKKLVCQACGGNDFLKQDGYFVCQHCKTKYLPDDIQKLLVEIDESTNTSNYLKLAHKALYDGDCAEAAHYANRALEIDSSLQEAWTIKQAADNLDVAARNYNQLLFRLPIHIAMVGIILFTSCLTLFLLPCIGVLVIAISPILIFPLFSCLQKAQEHAELTLQLYPDLPLALEIVNYKWFRKGPFADRVHRNYTKRSQQDEHPYGWDGSDPDYNYDYNYDYGSKRNK